MWHKPWFLCPTSSFPIVNGLNTMQIYEQHVSPMNKITILQYIKLRIQIVEAKSFLAQTLQNFHLVHHLDSRP